jgi:hypothetical protein
VLFTWLVVGHKYYYVCGSPNLNRPWSQVFSFTYGTGQSRVGGETFAVLADFGFYNAESLGKLIADAYAGRFDVLLHAGDFAYDLDTDKGMVGDGYMRQLQPVIAQFPYMGTCGNHEDASNFTHYKMRFAGWGENAGKNSGSGSSMFYSLDEGLVHFVFWNSEAWWAQPVDSQTRMMNWLVADLAAANANRASVPWIVSLAHKAFDMDDTLGSNGTGFGVWAMLNDAGVDLFLCGHIHYYSRGYPQLPNKDGTTTVDRASTTEYGTASNPQAVISNPLFMPFIITAAPGDQEVNRRRALSKEEREAEEAHPARAVGANPRTQATGTSNYGYGFLTIVNASTLHWRFETAVPHVNSTAANYTDDVWLVVDKHGPR